MLTLMVSSYSSSKGHLLQVHQDFAVILDLPVREKQKTKSRVKLQNCPSHGHVGAGF